MVKLPKSMIKVLMPVMSIMTPTCEVVTQKISESMDHPISLLDRIRIKLHLLGCELCARYERQLQIMRKMLQLNSEDMLEKESDTILSEEARQRIKREILR